MSTTTVVGAVLRGFIEEAVRYTGGHPPGRLVLTHPARWDNVRRQALVEAAMQAGFHPHGVLLVPEPVAAAAYHVGGVPEGRHIAIYDLGGGTFDTAVLRKVPGGFEVVGSPGGDETIGGEDFDHRLFDSAGRSIAQSDPGVWEKLRTSTERPWVRAANDMMTSARTAKERLSTYTTASILAREPDGGSHEVARTRTEFESLIVQDVERTLDELEDTLERAGLGVSDLEHVHFVGGSSRIPLVGRLAVGRFGDRVDTGTEARPTAAVEAVVLGALQAVGPPLLPVTPQPPRTPPPSSSPKPWVLILAGAVLGVLLFIVVVGLVVS